MDPMSTFDPSKPAMVHDRLDDRTFKWKPATMQANYEKYADPHTPGIKEWDGVCSHRARRAARSFPHSC
jgi:hypothetical protein